MKGGITGCILARNEERRIGEALESLMGWTEQVIVIDNQSEDGTVEIARRYGALILTAPRSTHFDAARNLAIEHAIGEWLFFLDADERVPARLGAELVRLVRERGHEFEALCVPFKHYFCGKWLQHAGWWPGYCRPQLLKKGRFRYNERLHSGAEVDGRKVYFPADDPELAIVHYSYDDLHHYLEKLNRYTDGEAESLLADGASHSWQAQLAHFVKDWQGYYEEGRADLDGMHGFVLSFMSAFYRYASRAKLWDLRRCKEGGRGRGGEGGTVGPAAEPVPANLREMLGFMIQVAEEGAAPWLEARHSPLTPSPSLPLSRCSGGRRSWIPVATRMRRGSSWRGCWRRGSRSPWRRTAGATRTRVWTRRCRLPSGSGRCRRRRPVNCSSPTPCPRCSGRRPTPASTLLGRCSRRTGSPRAGNSASTPWTGSGCPRSSIATPSSAAASIPRRSP